MPKIVLRIQKDGSVKVDAVGYQNDACEKDPVLSRLVSLIDEVDEIQLKYKKAVQESEQTVEIEEELF